MFGLSIWELLIVLAIVIFVFGPSRLKTIGSDLGGAIKGFRTAIKEEPAEEGRGRRNKRHCQQRNQPEVECLILAFRSS